MSKHFRNFNVNVVAMNDEYRYKLKRLSSMKELISIYLSSHKRRWITVRSIMNSIQPTSIDKNEKPFSYHEVRKWLHEVVNLSWRKVNIRPPNCLRCLFKADKEVYIHLLKKLEKFKFTWVYIDECHFNSSALHLYVWNKKREVPSIVIR